MSSHGSHVGGGANRAGRTQHVSRPAPHIGSRASSQHYRYPYPQMGHLSHSAYNRYLNPDIVRNRGIVRPANDDVFLASSECDTHMNCLQDYDSYYDCQRCVLNQGGSLRCADTVCP